MARIRKGSDVAEIVPFMSHGTGNGRPGLNGNPFSYMGYF